MATALYLDVGNAYNEPAERDLDVNGNSVAHVPSNLKTTAGADTTTNLVVDVTTGVNVGLEFGSWESPPLAAAATISGTITFNMCGFETQ
jgi:hypothetical protein